jgi:hypothetical protein
MTGLGMQISPILLLFHYTLPTTKQQRYQWYSEVVRTIAPETN